MTASSWGEPLSEEKKLILNGNLYAKEYGGGEKEATWRKGNKEGGITREDKDRAKWGEEGKGK